MERIANGGLLGQLIEGGSSRAVALTTNEQQCIQADKAVGLEFAGVDLIREYGKAPNFYVTEINGNPGTGIIDITGYNYFVDLVQHIETKTNQTASTPRCDYPSTGDSPSGRSQYPADYIALQQMDQNGQKMNGTQAGLMSFFRRKYGRITVR